MIIFAQIGTNFGSKMTNFDSKILTQFQIFFKVRSLADMVKDFAQLHKLFPDRPKHECFSKFYTSKPQNDGPYVKKTLVAHIEES